MDSIFQNVYDSLRESTVEVQKVVEQQAQLEEKVKAGRYSDATVKSEIGPRIEALKKQSITLADNAIAQAKQLVEEYKERVDARNNLDASEITDDIKLLQAGIPLTERDIETILRHNENNRTMTILALRYAEQHNLKIVNRPYKFEIEQQEAKRLADALDSILVYYPKWIGKKNAFEMLDKFFAVE